MPNATEMDHEGAIGPQDPKKDRSHAQQSQQSSQAQATPLVNGSTDQGSDDVLPNGVPGMHQATSDYEGWFRPIERGSMADPSNPPKLDPTWRQGISNKSLGRMIERVAQKCYTDLNQNPDADV